MSKANELQQDRTADGYQYLLRAPSDMPQVERDILYLVAQAPKHGIEEFYEAYGSPTERHPDGRQGTGGESEFSAIWCKNVDTPWSPTKVRAHVVRTELREAFEDADVSEHARDALEELEGGDGA